MARAPQGLAEDFSADWVAVEEVAKADSALDWETVVGAEEEAEGRGEAAVMEDLVVEEAVVVVEVEVEAAEVADSGEAAAVVEAAAADSEETEAACPRA